LELIKKLNPYEREAGSGFELSVA